MAWNQERVKELLQSRYKGRNIRDLWYGTRSHVVMVTFNDGSEQPIMNVEESISEEKVANLIERAI